MYACIEVHVHVCLHVRMYNLYANMYKYKTKDIIIDTTMYMYI